MAEVERRAAAAQPAPAGSDIENLPALLGRLGDHVMQLVDTKLSLIKVELKEDASFYARSGAFAAVGAGIAFVGLALVNVAIAFFISSLFGKDGPGVVTERYGPSAYGLGFLITGFVYLVIGGVVAYLMVNRMSGYNPVPTTSLEEIRKDKQWLKNEM